MRTAKSLPRALFSSTFFLAACLAMLAGTPRVGGEVKHITGAWTVRGDTSLRDQQIRLDGSLILPAGAKLTLEDCLLEIVGDYSRHHCVEWKGGDSGDRELHCRRVRQRRRYAGPHGVSPVRRDLGSLYLSGKGSNLIVTGRSHISELRMHTGGKSKVVGTPGEHELAASPCDERRQAGTGRRQGILAQP